MVGHFGYFYSFGNPTCCSEVLNSPSKVGTNNGKYIKTSPLSFLRVKVLTGLAIAYFQHYFKPPVKKPVCVTPLPFGNLSFSDPPTPRNFRDPPWGGYGYFLEPHNSHLKRSAKVTTCNVGIHNRGKVGEAWSSLYHTMGNHLSKDFKKSIHN